jgi:hypothetical protein
MKISILSLVMLAGSWLHAASLNDVSILLPLPAPSEFSTLLAGSSAGVRGPLLPPAFFKHVPALIVENDNGTTYANTLRMVALRLDPCFVEGGVGAPCRRQIRMVWQPVVPAGTMMSTRDAAVHSFYEFDEATWKSLLLALKPLSSGQSSDPLQIHPVMKAEGLRGPFWSQLKEVLLRYCGANNLVRITSMTVLGNEQIWGFEGFDVRDANIVPLTIPRTGQQSQVVAMNKKIPDEFRGGIKPLPSEDPLLFKLLVNSVSAKQTYSENDLQTVMATVFDYQNPRIHTTASLDCVSCHITDSAHRWGRQNFSQWDWRNGFKNRYPNPWYRAEGLITPFRSNQFRAFGYFTNTPVISQRTFNETIEVMAALTQISSSRINRGVRRR